MTATTTRKRRRMARDTEPETATTATSKPPSKLDVVEGMLLAPSGASIAEIMAATGWQQHSVRGAIAGALKKRGLVISSDKVDNTRRYRAERG